MKGKLSYLFFFLFQDAKLWENLEKCHNVKFPTKDATVSEVEG